MGINHVISSRCSSATMKNVFLSRYSLSTEPLGYQVNLRMLSVLVVVVMSLVMGQHGSSASPASECSCYTFDSHGFGLLSKGQTCNEGGELVSMETIGEWEFIKTQIQNKRNDYDNEWWIGLEKGDEGWKWLSNQSLTYDKWQPEEPSTDDPRETCVVIAKNYPPDTYGLFNNAPCRKWKGLICEYKVKGHNCNGDGHVRWCKETTPTATTESKTDITEVTPPPPTTTTTTSVTATITSVSTSATVKQPPPKRTMSRPDVSSPSKHLKTQQEYTELALTATEPDNAARTKMPFPKLAVIIIGTLIPGGAVLLCCVVLSVCRWKLKRREKPKRRPKHKDTNTENCTVDVVPGSSSGFPMDEQEMKSIVIQPNHAYVQDDSHVTTLLENSNDTEKVTIISHGCLISPMTHDGLDVCVYKTSVESTDRDSNQNKADTHIRKDIRKTPQEHTDLQTPGDAVAKVLVIYATVDKGKKKNKENKATEVVYAEVHKSNDKQTDTYAGVSDLNRDAVRSVPKAPSQPYQPTEYASVSLAPVSCETK